MSETSDAVQILGPWGKKLLAAGKLLAVLCAAIVPAISAYRSAAGDAAATAQVVKNKSEAGYQVTRAAMEELQHRVLVLEQAAHVAQATSPKRGARRPTPPIPVAVTAHPRPLPPDLDKAERQVYRSTTPPVQDGGP